MPMFIKKKNYLQNILHLRFFFFVSLLVPDTCVLSHVCMQLVGVTVERRKEWVFFVESDVRRAVRNPTLVHFIVF